HHGLLVTRVVNQHLVTWLHFAQMLQSEAVLDAVPHRGLLADEVVEAIGGWLSLHDPIVRHALSRERAAPTTRRSHPRSRPSPRHPSFPTACGRGTSGPSTPRRG